VDFVRRHPKATIFDPKTGLRSSVLLVHFDWDIAKAVGMPAPYDIGAQRATWASMGLTHWMGDEGFLASLSVRFQGMNFLGDVTTISGVVSKTWRGRSGNCYADCVLAAVNQRGETTMPIEATVALPSRAYGPVKWPVEVTADRDAADRSSGQSE
jgi:hypothetical protein